MIRRLRDVRSWWPPDGVSPVEMVVRAIVVGMALVFKWTTTNAGAGRARDEARGQPVSAQRCDELRLTGSGGANRVMEAELKRLVMRSPFGVRLEKPKREGEATLLYPFQPCIASGGMSIARLVLPHALGKAAAM